MPVSLNEFLQPGGAVARRLGGLYEFRSQQLEMAQAVEKALKNGEHLLVEAGTGVGKSFAYLLPAIDYAVSEKKRVVVSTHTISLQEQLIDKDIPLIQSLYPDEFTAVLVKGRNNYLCKRRLEQARGRQGMLFEFPEQLRTLKRIDEWSRQDHGGSLAELSGVPEPEIWDRVCAEHGNCLNRSCQHFRDCFWQAAKQRMRIGNVLVVNHALFFSDLALRISGINYLPKYDVAILDEAHTLEDVAGEHFGIKVSQNGVRYQLRMVYDARRNKGLLTTIKGELDTLKDEVHRLNILAEEFFEVCNQWQRDHGRANGRVHEANVVENYLSQPLRDLALHLKELGGELKSPEEKLEITSKGQRIGMLADELEALLDQRMPDAVYWVETGGRRPNLSLHAAPVSVADGLRVHLFEKLHSVTMCSATLCTSRREGRGEATPSFKYIAGRLGAEKASTLALGSPFDYANQATLYIEPDLPEPNDTVRFAPASCQRILHYLKETNGGAFVLFTSHSALTDTANRLAPELERMNLPILVQGQGDSRKVLLDKFRSTPNSVLFGTSSFWQGIDVRGEALRNVIIVKLPFAVPDEPLIQARLEQITRAGGNAFMEYSVPEAVIRLKQGFGRLIRSKTDRGIVVILDSRIKHKRYGRHFLDALPNCKTVIVQTQTTEPAENHVSGHD